ncbi:MAG: arsenosugar biosynthesis radical SAM protein ArsS [Chromatiales bacterium]|nr:arsenosugar biosynthesis radical SAM protein ArsS [Chromatiales bacterium]
MLATLPYLEKISFPSITRGKLTTLQVNLGYRCNLQCNHCHVNAGPRRTESMSAENISAIIELAEQGRFTTLDLTGGAPELHPQFRQLVEAVRKLGIHVIDRCNITILEEPGQEGLAEFLAVHGVEVVASMPCYLQENVDAQRGKGTFDSSIRGLQQLNSQGYGRDRDKTLNLVYNPQGPSLPPAQKALEKDYKARLKDEYEIDFNHLLTITNMPIQRFGSSLLSRGEFDSYMQLLRDNYQPQNLNGVMCRTLISVDWQGSLYDCDFNQMLELPMCGDGGDVLRLSQLSDLTLDGRPIVVRGHCYGCTAGQGSSCGGAL